jgi:parallel beta-helix repeat protein
LGIEFWTNSNNGVISGNVIDFSTVGSGEFGISATGYGMVIGDNLIRGTDSYGIEIIDRAVTCTGNMIRSPRGAGISVSLNAGHTDPGDIISITGNSIEDANSTSVSFAGIVVDGVAGVTPIGITIASNTIHGKAQGIRVTDTVTSFTVSGNTIYNTGGALTCINAIGTDGAITGNNIFRVSTAGDGNIPQAIQVVGNGNLVSGNRIVGNSRITNGVVIASGAANVLVGSNHYTGIITNSVVSASVLGTVVVQGGLGNVGVSLQTANRCLDFVNSSNDSVVSQNVAPSVGTYTVAALPTSAIGAAQLAYASNGRKNGEGSGAGTGVLVFRDGSAWRACDTGATVAS